jgi:hypothetical protein
MMTKRSESLGKPSQWGVSFLFLPLRAENWPTVDDYNQRHLYVQFLLNEPALAVGFRVRITTKKATAIREQLPAWTKALRGFTDDHRILALKYPGFHQPIDQTVPLAVDDDWIQIVLSKAEVFLSIERNRPLLEIETSTTVEALVREDRSLVEETGLLALSG